jgi:hypothetical protein
MIKITIENTDNNKTKVIETNSYYLVTAKVEGGFVRCIEKSDTNGDIEEMLAIATKQTHAAENAKEIFALAELLNGGELSAVEIRRANSEN